MKLTVTDRASTWFKDELALPEGAGVRFYGKVYGNTNAHEGFSVGMMRDDDVVAPIMTTQKDGVTYWADDHDAWFFNNLNLTVDYDDQGDEPKYTFAAEDGGPLPDTGSSASVKEP